MVLSIAVDGPAGAGKSTIAKLVSEKFQLMYINTGSMYRAVTLFALRNKISSKDINGLMNVIKSMDMHFKGNNLIVNGEDITELIVMPEISKKVSEYAAVKEVREEMAAMQRNMALKYNVIMDGRDIGTVVLKDAFIKFFITASPEERARRRFNELKDKGIAVEYNAILNDINKRDYDDSNREVDPLKKAEDAIELDTSRMGIQEVVEVISFYINEKMKKYNLVVN